MERHLPQLEKFVGDVFHLVETDSGGGQSLDKETVLDTLRRWREGPSGRTWGLSEDLRRPSERRKSESFRNELAVPCARELSARVRHRETTQDMWKAKAHCNSSGCRIVSHFMQLFEVRTVDDVLPAMNAAFTRLSELSTLHHAVCDASSSRFCRNCRGGNHPAVAFLPECAIGGPRASNRMDKTFLQRRLVYTKVFCTSERK